MATCIIILCIRTRTNELSTKNAIFFSVQLTRCILELLHYVAKLYLSKNKSTYSKPKSQYCKDHTSVIYTAASPIVTPFPSSSVLSLLLPSVGGPRFDSSPVLVGLWLPFVIGWVMARLITSNITASGVENF